MSGTADYFSSDTIAAIATSLGGDGGVGIIRLSGPGSLLAARTCTRGLESPKPRYCHRITFLAAGAVLDDGLGVYFEPGASFTGEEVVELQLHGGRYTLQEALKTLMTEGGCRLALPGEFSFRAVRNGKMSVVAAEAVNQLVKAKSAYETWSARQNLSGARNAAIEGVSASIKDLLAKCELSIDFADQDVEVISKEGFVAQLDDAERALADLKKRLELSRRIAQGPLVLFAGLPNSGKSTLFNAILAEDRAIVSDIPGTTRDVITEEIHLGPYRVRLADTAGMRLADDAIEREGIQRAEQLLGRADVVVFLCDGSVGLERALSALPARNADIIAVNKRDLMGDAGLERATGLFEGPLAGKTVCFLSARSGDGVAELLEAIKASLDRKLALGLSTPLPTEYQLEMLARCEEGLRESRELLSATGMTNPELLAVTLRRAANALSAIAGEASPDEILNKIFSEFCIGK